MKIGIGSDHGGYLLKLEIKTYLSEKGYEIVARCFRERLESIKE